MFCGRVKFPSPVPVGVITQYRPVRRFSPEALPEALAWSPSTRSTLISEKLSVVISNTAPVSPKVTLPVPGMLSDRLYFPPSSLIEKTLAVAAGVPSSKIWAEAPWIVSVAKAFLPEPLIVCVLFPSNVTVPLRDRKLPSFIQSPARLIAAFPVPTSRVEP